MSDTGNGKLVNFRVDYSGNTREEIKSVLLDARKKGLGEQANAAMAVIQARLSSDPLEFGELVKEFKILKLLVHVAVVRPVIVRFAINPEARIVIIMQVRLLSQDA